MPGIDDNIKVFKMVSDIISQIETRSPISPREENMKYRVESNTQLFLRVNGSAGSTKTITVVGLKDSTLFENKTKAEQAIQFWGGGTAVPAATDEQVAEVELVCKYVEAAQRQAGVANTQAFTLLCKELREGKHRG
jgi:hypothetical protein